ncbi:dTMP kinase [Lawsonibacter sp. LCP25S3_G6]|uniref:dTMP kinase n=1 Tax=unclassified Lawsonibacter TaxID=2617946 RepID=UPI003F94CA62
MFIAIDGPDGSGKTTLSKLLVDHWKSEGTAAVYTCEPTYDSEPGKQLRQIMRSGEIIDIYAFANLFVEDRKEHIRAFIMPAIMRGEIVVCDRYKYSALAYQQLQGVDANYLIEKNWTCLVPDFIFILLPQDSEVLCRRIAQRGKAHDVFEERNFLQRTISYYEKLPEYFPEEKIFFLNAEDTLEKNVQRIKKIISK